MTERRGERAVELEGADFLGWKAQSFDTDAGHSTLSHSLPRLAGSRTSRRSSWLGEFSVRVITIDEVIASKEKLGRPKDAAARPPRAEPLGPTSRGEAAGELSSSMPQG